MRIYSEWWEHKVVVSHILIYHQSILSILHQIQMPCLSCLIPNACLSSTKLPHTSQKNLLLSWGTISSSALLSNSQYTCYHSVRLFNITMNLITSMQAILRYTCQYNPKILAASVISHLFTYTSLSPWRLAFSRSTPHLSELGFKRSMNKYWVRTMTKWEVDVEDHGKHGGTP